MEIEIGRIKATLSAAPRDLEERLNQRFSEFDDTLNQKWSCRTGARTPDPPKTFGRAETDLIFHVTGFPPPPSFSQQMDGLTDAQQDIERRYERAKNGVGNRFIGRSGYGGGAALNRRLQQLFGTYPYRIPYWVPFFRDHKGRVAELFTAVYYRRLFLEYDGLRPGEQIVVSIPAWVWHGIMLWGDCGVVGYMPYPRPSWERLGDPIDFAPRTKDARRAKILTKRLQLDTLKGQQDEIDGLKKKIEDEIAAEEAALEEEEGQ